MITQALDSDASSFFLHDPGADEIVLFGSFRGVSRIDLIHIPFQAQSIVGKVLLSKEPHLSPDTAVDPYHNKETEKKTGYAIRNLIAVPFELQLQAGRTDHLVLEVMNRHNHLRFDGNDRELLRRRLADHGVTVSEGSIERYSERINTIISERSDSLLADEDAPQLEGILDSSASPLAFSDAVSILQRKPIRTYDATDLKLCSQLLDVMMGDLQEAASAKDRAGREERLETMIRAVLEDRDDDAWREFFPEDEGTNVLVWRDISDEGRTLGDAPSLPAGFSDRCRREFRRLAEEGGERQSEITLDGARAVVATRETAGAALLFTGERAPEYDDRLALRFLVAHIFEKNSMDGSAVSGGPYHVPDRDRVAFDQAGLGMMLVDEAGEIIRFNETFSDIAGRNTEEMVGLSWQDALPRLKRLGIVQQLNHLAHDQKKASILYDVEGTTPSGDKAIYVMGQSRVEESDRRLRFIWIVDVSAQYWSRLMTPKPPLIAADVAT